MTNVTEFKKPITGGGDSGPTAECLIIEKVDNGYILRSVRGGAEDGCVEECMVYTDRSALLRDISTKI